MSTKDDAELVEEVRRGNRTAFDFLMEKYQNKVFGMMLMWYVTDESGVTGMDSMQPDRNLTHSEPTIKT